MKKDLFIEKIKSASSTVDSNYCSAVIRASLQAIPEKQNQKGTINTIIVMEELAELQQELSKALRGEGNRMSLIEELSDVFLSIKYVQEIFDISDEILARAVNVKLDRLDERNNL